MSTDTRSHDKADSNLKKPKVDSIFDEANKKFDDQTPKKLKLDTKNKLGIEVQISRGKSDHQTGDRLFYVNYLAL